MKFYNPPNLNSNTAGDNRRQYQRFCFLGWHWVADNHSLFGMIRDVYPLSCLNKDVRISVCQGCLKHWYVTGRMHKENTFSESYCFEVRDFRDRHLRRVLKRKNERRAKVFREVNVFGHPAAQKRRCLK